MKNLSTWIPISITVFAIIINFGVTYGQTSVEIESIKSDSSKMQLEIEKMKDKSDSDINGIKDALNESKVEQAEMKGMLKQMMKMMEDK